MSKKIIGSLELNRIYQTDCVEGMRMLPDNSVDLIVIDPPYNIGIKGAEWDKYGKEEYIEFIGNVFAECQRTLKDNGSFYWFHNDMPQIAQLMTWLSGNSHFIFNSFITWDKGDWRSLSWKNPSNKSKLRSWFNNAEYCLFYTLQDESGSNEAAQRVVRDYLRQERDKAGLTNKQVNTLLDYPSNGGGYASHYMGNVLTQCSLPTEEHYVKLQERTGMFNKPYEELRRDYEDARYTHNLSQNHNNVWRYKTENRGKYHACQKPLTVIERIINTSSNEGDVVLDCFMGSGTTAVAALRNNRNFIGFELESDYVQIANQRLESVQDELAERRLTENNEI
jgi:DNA modification methylase